MTGVGFRIFFYPDDNDTPVRVARKKFEAGLFPEYAGRSLRYMFVVLDLIERRPDVISRVDAGVLYFDETGDYRPASMKSAGIAMNLHYEEHRASTVEGVVDITLARRRACWEETYRWTPTPKDLGKVINIIWPERRRKS